MIGHSTGIIEKISWKAILAGIATFLGLYFGFPEYALNIRPHFEKVIGTCVLCYIEGAISATITVILVLKFLSQKLQKAEGRNKGTDRKPILKVRNPRAEVHNAGTGHEFKNLIFDIENKGEEEAKDCRIKIKVKEFWDSFEILNPNFPDRATRFSIDPSDTKSVQLCQITKQHSTTTVIHIESLGKYSALTKGIYHIDIRLFAKNFVDKEVHQLKLNLSSWENVEIELVS